MITATERKPFSVARLLLGIVLLLPAALIFVIAFLVPTVQAVLLSLQKYDLIGPAQFIGAKNYLDLFKDPLFGQAATHSLLVVGVRLLAVLILPLLIGWLWGRQSPWLRMPGRLALAIPLALSSPVAIALLWVVATARGNPLQAYSLSNPATALTSYLLLEFVAFLGVGGVLTAIALSLAWRGQRSGRAVLGVLALAAILAVASGLDSFTLPYASTSGGPTNATMTLPLLAFRNAFVYFRMGYASAEAVLLLAPALLLGLLFGLVGAGLNLRLNVVPFERERPISWWRLLLGVPALLLLVLPAFTGSLWATVRGVSSGALADYVASPRLPISLGLRNGLLVPVLTIALVQLPVAYLAGLALGLLRPFGKWGGRLALALLMACGFVPPMVQAIGWFDTVRRAGLLNTTLIAGLPLVAGPASLFIFYLFFAGRREAFERARLAGESSFVAFFKVAFLPSLPIGVLAGALAFLIAGQSIVWPLTTVNSARLYTLSMQALASSRAQSANIDGTIAVAWLLLASWGVALFLVWGLVQAFMSEKLELAAGEEEIDKAAM